MEFEKPWKLLVTYALAKFGRLLPSGWEIALCIHRTFLGPASRATSLVAFDG
jgi:hypothetical protein